MVDRDGPQAGVGRASDSVRRSDERSVTDGGEQAVDSSAKADAVETSSADLSGNGAVNGHLVRTRWLRTGWGGGEWSRSRL